MGVPVFLFSFLFSAHAWFHIPGPFVLPPTQQPIGTDTEVHAFLMKQLAEGATIIGVHTSRPT